MDNCLITVLEEFIDNIKLNVTTTASRCGNKMAVTRLPSSVPSKFTRNNASPFTKGTEMQDQGKFSRMYVIKEPQVETKYSDITRHSRRSSNIDSFKEPERRASGKLVYPCKIPTKIRRNSLCVRDSHTVMDKILKNVEITSEKNEQRTSSLKKSEENLNKTYIKSQTSLTMDGKYILDPKIFTNISPPSYLRSDNLNISNETVLGASATNSESTASLTSRRKILNKSTQGKLLANNITKKNDPNYAVDFVDYDSEIAIYSSYTGGEYLTGSYNGECKLNCNNEEYPKKVNTNNNEKIASGSPTLEFIRNPTKYYYFNMLNCKNNETTPTEILHMKKKLKKLESTHIECHEETEEVNSSESCAEEKNVSNEKTSVLGPEKCTITYDSPFQDDLPDVGTYEEFVAGRRNEKISVNINKGKTLLQEIEVETYEDFERGLKKYDQKRLRGLECSMFKSGNIVMTRN